MWLLALVLLYTKGHIYTVTEIWADTTIQYFSDEFVTKRHSISKVALVNYSVSSDILHMEQVLVRRGTQVRGYYACMPR